MGPYQRTPKKVTRAIKYPGLGVRSVGPVGDFLDRWLATPIYLSLSRFQDTEFGSGVLPSNFTTVNSFSLFPQ